MRLNHCRNDQIDVISAAISTAPHSQRTSTRTSRNPARQTSIKKLEFNMLQPEDYNNFPRCNSEVLFKKRDVAHVLFGDVWMP